MDLIWLGDGGDREQAHNKNGHVKLMRLLGWEHDNQLLYTLNEILDIQFIETLSQTAYVCTPSNACTAYVSPKINRIHANRQKSGQYKNTRDRLLLLT